MKNKIIFLIIGLIIGSGVGVGAAIIINANQVDYKENKTVENALNDLYSRSNYGDATASDITEGKTALVNGEKVTGNLQKKSSVSGTITCTTSDNTFIETGFRAKMIYYYCPQYARFGVYNYDHNQSSLFWRNNQGGGNTWVTMSASQYINGITDTGFNVYCYKGYDVIYAASN